MKKFFSTNYSNFSFNLSMFLLRIGVSCMLFINHGLPKLNRFSELKTSFSDPLHIGSATSLVLIMFGEIICTVLLVLGLLTRFAAFVLVIAFIVIVFIVQKNRPLKDHELAALFLAAFLTILFCGPGKWSLDKLIGK
jgi:putative oxidoreductase